MGLNFVAAKTAIWTYGRKRYALRLLLYEINFFYPSDDSQQYSISFYLNYLARWPDLCLVQEAPNGRMMGYGKQSLIVLSVHFSELLPHQ